MSHCYNEAQRIEVLCLYVEDYTKAEIANLTGLSQQVIGNIFSHMFQRASQHHADFRGIRELLRQLDAIDNAEIQAHAAPQPEPTPL